MNPKLTPSFTHLPWTGNHPEIPRCHPCKAATWKLDKFEEEEGEIEERSWTTSQGIKHEMNRGGLEGQLETFHWRFQEEEESGAQHRRSRPEALFLWVFCEFEAWTWKKGLELGNWCLLVWIQGRKDWCYKFSEPRCMIRATGTQI